MNTSRNRSCTPLLCALPLLALLLTTSCGHARSRAAAAPAAAPATAAAAAEQTPDELPLPAIPDALRTPGARAGYLIEHFWDSFDFRDTLRGRDLDFLEQNFVNFIALFPHADTVSQRPAAARLLRKAEADPEAFRLLGETIEKYLYDPNSPMLNEASYALFLEEMLRSPLLDDPYARMRPEMQLADIGKNRPGTEAADFSYLTRSGKRARLRNTPGETILLLFYDPDCSHCAEIIEALAADSRLAEAVEQGRTKVLMVYPDDDKALWKSTCARYPASWEVAMATDGTIAEQMAYVLRAMPSIYLLDRDKRVILKDAPPAAVVAALAAGSGF